LIIDSFSLLLHSEVQRHIRESPEKHHKTA